MLQRLVEASWRADIVALVNAARSERELGELLCKELRRACDAELAFLVTSRSGGAPPEIAGSAGFEGGDAQLLRDPLVIGGLATAGPALHAGEGLLGAGAARLLIVPIRSASGDAALLGVARTRDREFPDPERQRLEALAADVGHALERFWLAADRERHMVEQRSLARAARSLAESLDVDRVLATLCREVASALRADLVVVYFGDPSGGLTATAGHGVPDGFLGFRREPGEGLCGEAVRTGRPQISNAYARDGYLPAATAALRDVKSGASAPLRRRDGGPVDGALSVGFHGDRWIGDADVGLLSAFADLAGVAVRNAEAHAAAQRAATIDSLTGCVNRAAFDHRLREEISRAEREGGGFTLALIDLDDFKSINEEHGHLAGDTVLRAVGEILRGAVRLHDTAARVGGDEFALLLPGASSAAAEPVVDRALRELRRAPLPGGGLLGAAAGVASWRPGEQPTTLIERSDVALREAKHDPVHPTRRVEALEPGGEARGRARGSAKLADAVAVGGKLSRLLDARAIAEVAVQELNETLGYERCLVARLHESGRVSPVALAGASWDAAVRWSRPQDEGAVGRCLRERRPVLVDDAARDPQFSGGVASGMRSQLAMPLYAGAELWGALDLQAGEPGAFSTDDAQIVGTVADHVGAALRTAALYSQLEQTYQGTAEALAAALEAKDDYTADHARSIADLAVDVGKELDLPAETLRDVRYGAIFHDIGKIAIPDAILNKPGELSPDEFEVIKRHPITGEQILAPVPFLANVRRIVRHDHERWDGTGYPDGLRGSQIPIGARIVFVVDAYHAMTSDRPYRMGMGDGAAKAELRAGAGSQFDPSVVDALLAVLERRSAVVTAN